MQKQAFLIIAHNEFEVLQCLIDALDDSDNDIYIHIDARVKQMPSLTSKCSRLIVLENRMKVIWGTSIQPECEMRLMEVAMNSGIRYVFYHIISGTHYPLVSLEGLNKFFEPYMGKSVLQPMNYSEEEKKMRFGRYHYFMTYYISGPKSLNKTYRFLWRANLFLQKNLHIIRDVSHCHGKASNWVSLSHDAVKTILSDKEILRNRFSRTYCSDEWFVPSVLEGHQLPVVYTDKLLFQEWIHSNPRVLTETDYNLLSDSCCLWGRKFTKQSMALIKKLRNERA